MADSRKVFEIKAQWDGEAAVWWCSNDELPLTTEAATFEKLVSRVLEIAPEIAAENGLAVPGDEIELHFVGGARAIGAGGRRGVNACDFRSRATALVDAGRLYTFVRTGKGSHEIWHSPVPSVGSRCRSGSSAAIPQMVSLYRLACRKPFEAAGALLNGAAAVGY